MIAYSKIKISKCQEFGWVIGCALLCFAIFSFLKNYDYFPYFLVIGLVFIVFGTWTPFLLKPLGFLWYNLGLVMHKITFPLLMLILFFFILFPYAFFLKLGGIKFLQVHTKDMANTYWQTYDKEVIDISYFKRQF